MTERRRPNKRAALALVAAILALAGASFVIPDRLQVAGFDTPGSDSARATARLHAALGYDPEPGIVVLARSRRQISSPSGRDAIVAVGDQLARDPAVGHVEMPVGPRAEPVLISHSGRDALILVHFRQLSEEGSGSAIDRIRSHLHSSSLRLEYDGFDVGFLDDNRLVRRDLLRAELIALPLLALLMIAIFRGRHAARLPLVIGVLSVLGTFAGLRLLSRVAAVSVYSLNLSSGLGLGLAVDYGLFLVSRYREEIYTNGFRPEAVQTTMTTAGRAVLFSGATVAVAAAALLFFPQPFIYSMGIGGILTSVLSAAIALVVVPAMLPTVGRHTDLRDENAARRAGVGTNVREGWWYRFSHWVMRHAIVVAVASSAVILGLAIPATRLTLTFLDARALPPGLESRRVADAITSEFVPHLDFPIEIAVGSSVASHPAAAQALQARVAALPGAGLVGRVARAPDGSGFLQLLPRGPPLGGQSQGLISELRALGAPLLVGGRIADFVDLKASIEQSAVPALVFLALVTLIILFLMTDSLVLAAKALLMNSLTIFAVFGLLVAIFQDRVLGIASLLGFNGPSAIETSISVVVIGVTLGLATDYSILLLSRVKEEHDAGRPNDEAVARGLERSGRVITNAAVVQAVALLALASSPVYLVKELAVGIAAGVAIDATLVRACLVPSLMKILGQVNWWAPRPLHRLRARLERSLPGGRVARPAAVRASDD